MRSWLIFGFLFAIGCSQGSGSSSDNYLYALRHPAGLNILPNHQFSLDFPDSYTSVCNKTIVRDQGKAGTCTAFGVSSVLTYYAGFPVSVLWLFNANIYKSKKGGYVILAPR
jgi:C1A family cysteine protease